MGYNNREYEQYNLVNGASPSVTLFTGKGILHSVVINTPSPAAITLTDGGSPVAIITAAPVGDIQYDIVIAKSLVVNAASSPNVVITYTQG